MPTKARLPPKTPGRKGRRPDFAGQRARTPWNGLLLSTLANEEGSSNVSLETDLFDIERGFWLRGKDHFLAHLDDQCLLAFPQMGEMHGVHSREDVAATATTQNRWRELRISDRHVLQANEEVGIISYRADVQRADGQPYTALVSSAYVRRDGDWKLAFHQHSPIDESQA